MNHAMKNAIRIAGVAAGLAAAVWALRDRMLPDPAPPTNEPPRFRTGGSTGSDDLTRIKGIGPALATRLSEAGISSFRTLAAEDAASVAEIANTTEAAAERWINAASTLD